MPVPIVLTGLHRSGTTWVGQIVAAASGEPMIHEPLNLPHGMKGVPCWYPYHPGGTPQPAEAPNAKYMEGMLQDLIQGHARWVRKNPKASLYRKVGRAVFGTRAEREYRAAFRNGVPERLFVKDPFCLFLSPYLIEQFNAKVVITIRHPGALIVSMRRMGWSPHIESLVAQHGLLTRYLAEFDERELIGRSSDDDIFANAIFWLAAYRFSRDIAERYPENVIILRHEDISLRAESSLALLVAHLEIQDGLPKADAFVEKTTSGKTVVPTAGVLHDFSRDAAALAHHWKKKLPEIEKSRLSALLSIELTEFSGNAS